jgi:hypothetical protein
MVTEALTSIKRLFSEPNISSVIASEAKQSISQQAEEWIASSLRSSQ